MALENILENQYISTSLAVFLVLYGGLAAPKLPSSMVKLFSNPIFRMFVIFLIAYTSSKNHSIALVATIVLILIMQESNDSENDKVKVTNNLVNVDSTSRAIITKKKFNMDEEESNGEGEVIHILKDKSTITESQLINSVINHEISNLQSNNIVSQDDKTTNLVAEIDAPTQAVIPEVEEKVEVPKRQVAENIPQPLDNTDDVHGTEIVDYPLSKNLENGFNTVPIRSTRGLDKKSCGEKTSSCDKCTTCDSFKKDNYQIDTDDMILGYDGNGFYNFGNL